MAGRISKRSRNPPDIRISCIIFITGHADCVVSVFPNVRTARKISNTLQKKTPKTAVIMLLFVFCFVLAAGFKNKRNSIGLPHTKRIYPFAGFVLWYLKKYPSRLLLWFLAVSMFQCPQRIRKLQYHTTQKSMEI